MLDCNSAVIILMAWGTAWASSSILHYPGTFQVRPGYRRAALGDLQSCCSRSASHYFRCKDKHTKDQRSKVVIWTWFSRLQELEVLASKPFCFFKTIPLSQLSGVPSSFQFFFFLRSPYFQTLISLKWSRGGMVRGAVEGTGSECFLLTGSICQSC